MLPLLHHPPFPCQPRCCTKRIIHVSRRLMRRIGAPVARSTYDSDSDSSILIRRRIKDRHTTHINTHTHKHDQQTQHDQHQIMGICASKLSESDDHDGSSTPPPLQSALTALVTSSDSTSGTTAEARRVQGKKVKKAVALGHMETALSLSIVVFDDLSGQVPLFGPVLSVLGQFVHAAGCMCWDDTFGCHADTFFPLSRLSLVQLSSASWHSPRPKRRSTCTVM